MPKSLPDYEGRFKKQYQKNFPLVRKELKEGKKWIIEKIQNWCERTGFTFESVAEKIRKDDMFAFCFIKDPAKQNIFEKTAQKYIKNINGVTDFEKLPDRGEGGKYVVNGKVDNSKPKGTVGAKSIDFKWKVGKKVFYASHKYTREGGGAQDNQYTELKLFIENANASVKKDTYFIAIADGEYFNTKDEDGVSKIENLKQLAKNKRGVFAITIEELSDLIQSIK